MIFCSKYKMLIPSELTVYRYNFNYVNKLHTRVYVNHLDYNVVWTR